MALAVPRSASRIPRGVFLVAHLDDAVVAVADIPVVDAVGTMADVEVCNCFDL